MSKPKVVVGAIVVAVMIFASARISAAQAVQSQGMSKSSREAIRVGGNVQESKLIYRVDPAMPEQAKAARISGIVILQVTVNEEGEVTDIRIVRGHPLLGEPAVNAVKQWRYSPTYLNGEAVPVIAAVTVPFDAQGNQSLILDEAGVLRDRATKLDGEALLQQIKESKRRVIIFPDPNLPFRAIEDNFRALEKNEIQVDLVSGFTVREGRLFQTRALGFPGAPEVILDRDRLAALAREDLLKTFPERFQIPIIYQLFISEVGEIVGIHQQIGPKIISLPSVESELLRTKGSRKNYLAFCCWPPDPLARRERRAIPEVVCEERATKPAGLRAAA
jgi:TonB family protein